jgi:hypothetical protein
MSYLKRRIDVTFNYGKGALGDDPGQDVTITGHRVSLSLSLNGGASQPTAQMRIYGMPLQRLNELTRVGWRTTDFRKNQVLISAGDENGRMSLVHTGDVLTAYVDLNAAPDVVFEVISNPTIFVAIKPVGASSYPGSADAATILATLAKTMGVGFKNNGVSVMLQNTYLPGTAWAQVERCAQAARINYSLDRGTLTIWPRGGASVPDSASIRIAPDTGLVGYPAFTGSGISVRTLFNPDVILGSRLNVESSLDAKTSIHTASGQWVASGIYHTLEAETPNGQWFTDIACTRGLVNA